jgi:phenylalanine-4-hydroxylase
MIGGKTRRDLVELDRDHPGFRDAEYRRRRNEIARIALEYEEGTPVPEVDYTDEEQGVWREVWRHLTPMHEERACRAYLEAGRELGLDHKKVPQFSELNPVIEKKTGFSMLPVAGLVSPRVFLEYLGRDVFLATQYMRHHSRPLYTPEPDVIHELVGHAATLVHNDFVFLNRLFGEAVKNASAETELALIRVYWWTVEFGVAREDSELKAYGAGLLSSFGELEAFREHAQLLPFDIERAAQTAFDPTDYQGVLFVAESFGAMVDQVSTWLRGLISAHR